jgi:hypothetical protein
VDNTGEPALICHPLGAGHVILCTYPLEYFAAEQPQVNPENCWRLYSALATFAGVPRLVSAQDPRVLVALIDTDGPCNLVIANTADERVETRIQCEPGVSIALGNAKHTQDTVPTTVTLSPFEVIQARATGLRSDRRVV